MKAFLVFAFAAAIGSWSLTSHQATAGGNESKRDSDAVKELIKLDQEWVAAGKQA